MPTLAPNYVADDVQLVLQSENASSGTAGDRVLKLVELAPGVTEDEVRDNTGPTLV